MYIKYIYTPLTNNLFSIFGLFSVFGGLKILLELKTKKNVACTCVTYGGRTEERG